eukprot:Pompholyxophrys_punicea_v1_NODE_42_length_4624_cov_10.963927.p3 type:complete len:163 gc:universal NODE_42_length_4624_cov_10.963927:4162-3674(-)
MKTTTATATAPRPPTPATTTTATTTAPKAKPLKKNNSQTTAQNAPKNSLTPSRVATDDHSKFRSGLGQGPSLVFGCQQGPFWPRPAGFFFGGRVQACYKGFFSGELAFLAQPWLCPQPNPSAILSLSLPMNCCVRGIARDEPVLLFFTSIFPVEFVTKSSAE